MPWRDLIPELPAGKPVDPVNGYPPSHFANFWFGKWFYWHDYPACSYAVDQVALEPTIEMAGYPPLPEQPGVPRLLAKPIFGAAAGANCGTKAAPLGM